VSKVVRQTSLECYAEIKKSGVLKKLQLKAYHALARYGEEKDGLTQLEMIEITGIPNESLTPIPARLVKMDLIKEVDKKKYKGKNRLCYKITGKTYPVRKSLIPSSKSYKELYEEALLKILQMEQDIERAGVRIKILRNNQAGGAVPEVDPLQMNLFEEAKNGK